MGGGELGVGESPAMGPSIRPMGPGGFIMKKKVSPKKQPEILKFNKNYKKSFNKFNTGKKSSGKI